MVYSTIPLDAYLGGGSAFAVTLTDVYAPNVICYGAAIAVPPDTTPPNDPTNVASTSHTVGTPSNDNTIDMTWTVGTDPGGSGVDGYDTAFNNTSPPICSQSKDLEEGATGTSSVALGDGSWYFHICTVDNAGNWTSTVVLGAFVIDTTPPIDPTNVVSTSHTVGTPSSDNTIDMTWTVGTDPGGSGVDGYDSAFNNTSTATCSQSKDLEEGATSITSSALGDGSWYYHICTVDNAGNWTSTVVLGAFDIDTTPPTDPTNVASTSHAVGTPSSDNTIDMTWTVGTDPGGSGVDGYDSAFNNTSTPTCSQSKDLEEGATGTSSNALGDGSWYFHVCTVDNTGNWTSTVVLGAFVIDTTPPNDPTNVASTSHTVGTPSNDNTIDIGWTVGTDPGGSGVDGYDTAFNNTSTQSNPYCQLFSIEGRDAIFGDEAVLCEVWHSWFRRNMVCGWRHRKKGGSGG